MITDTTSKLLGAISGLTDKEREAALEALRAAGLKNSRGMLTLSEFAIEEIMRPHTCENCEFRHGGRKCHGGDSTENHAYGHTISDINDVCAGWMPDEEPWRWARKELEQIIYYGET